MALSKEQQAEKDALAVERKKTLATASALQFMRNNPDYYPWDENGQAMQKYVTENNLDPTLVSSWQQAYDTLTLQGKIQPAPSAEIQQPEVIVERRAPRTGTMHGTKVSEHDAEQLAELKAMAKTKEGFAALQKQVRAEQSKFKIHAERHGINYDAKQ
jgi:hypothetical protein